MLNSDCFEATVRKSIVRGQEASSSGGQNTRNPVMRREPNRLLLGNDVNYLTPDGLGKGGSRRLGIRAKLHDVWTSA